MRHVLLVLLGCVLLCVGIGAYSEPLRNSSELVAARTATTTAPQIRHSTSTSFTTHSASAIPTHSVSASALSIQTDIASVAATLPGQTAAAKAVNAGVSLAIASNDLMPTSGSEPQYSPHDWNNPFIGPGNNCYAYACDDASDLRMNDCDFPQPGSTAGELPCDRSEFTVDLVRKRAIADGLAPVPHGRENDAPPEGFYKVAMFIDPGKDYHWYRQDDDGHWSHKLGDGPVLNVDGDGHLITDPRTASQNYENHFDPITGHPIGGYNYTQFGGFFYIPEGGIRLRSGHG